MIPGEYFIKPGEIELNKGRKTLTLTVSNSGDRPIQVGSHYHFFETNPALQFDRAKARGMRLDIAAGTAVRFEPGQSREVTLVAVAGGANHLRLSPSGHGKAEEMTRLQIAMREDLSARIMTGELAPARHVHSAAIRCWEPGSNLPRGALPIAAPHPGRPDLGDRHIRQNQTRAIWQR